MVSRIVVGTDGSETAGEAVRQAIDMAKVTGASLLIVSAYDERAPHDPGTAYDPTVREGPDTAPLPSDVGRPVGARAAVLGTLEAAVATASEAGVSDVSSSAREGDPAEAIITAADETHADLIVVGNKGMTGAKRFLLGSVPNKITHHAPCSVLVVRTT